MIRLVAFFVTLGMLGLAALGGRALYDVLNTPDPDPAPLEIAALAPEEGTGTPAPPPARRRWPALFGELQPPAPPKPPEPPKPAEEAQPPAPPQPPIPPLDSLGYQLKGLVRAGNTVWAMVSHPTGELLLRAGDTFDQGLLVARITDEGVWVVREGGGEQVLLGFPD